jgi:glyoxylase-like metal-dependent hydrolase (beta-lactamase superfamily II)
MLAVHRLAPGLWRWTAPHPGWTPDRGGAGGWEQSVGCVYYEAPEATVLIDPLAPPAGTPDEERFWNALDRDVERLALPVAVLIGNAYHGRGADAIVARYGARHRTTVHVPADARARVSCSATLKFGDDAKLPGNVHAHAIAGLDVGETALWIPSHRALVFADAVIGAGAGTVRIAPPSWAAEGKEAAVRYASEFRASLERLVDLDPVFLLPSHGEPVLEAGAQSLARAVMSPAWGED